MAMYGSNKFAYNVRELYITKGLHINHMIAGAQSPEGSRWHVPEKGVAEKTIRRLGLYKITSLQNHPHFTSICIFEANVKNMKKHEDLRTARF